MEGKLIKCSVILLLTTLLTACSSMSPQECKTANWQSIGYSDGQSGVSSNRVNDYIKDCAEAGVSVDTAQWQKAYEKGLNLYCIPENGYRVGRAGEEYYGVCASEQFVKRYNQGHKEYLLETRLEEIDTELQSIRTQIENSSDNEQKKRLREQEKSLLNERSSLLQPSYSFSIIF
ncbi:DUF2799 domain-containing protein [Psychromonas aquimarina]|uniref:DUF2799 domain-containing protein n=1 Tax=Psychromonas aquimarina TaxID=444919 RepID=UPI00041F4557|nr:DUF2799 domain-containing protein [Psychromonas aquimarina]